MSATSADSDVRLLLLSRYEALGASSRLRHYQFLPLLAEYGIRVKVEPLLSDAYLERLYANRRSGFKEIAARYGHRLVSTLAARRFDLVWLEKELFPWFPALAEVFLACRVPYVVDYDDAQFHRYDLHHAHWVRRLLGRKIDRVMRHATTVTAGNAYVAEHARRAGARSVVVIPTVVDTARYDLPTSADPTAFTIGWIGSPGTQQYLSLVALELRRLQEAGSRLLLIGASDHALADLEVERRPWSEATEAADLAAIDVGIMPLPDEPWERGKCGYKLIQYMAAAKPVVASPVGANMEIVEHGVTGFLAATPTEWYSALSTLQSDSGLRRRMGLAGKRRVEEHYSLHVAGPQLAEVLLRAVRRG